MKIDTILPSKRQTVFLTRYPSSHPAKIYFDLCRSLQRSNLVLMVKYTGFPVFVSTERVSTNIQLNLQDVLLVCTGVYCHRSYGIHFRRYK